MRSKIIILGFAIFFSSIGNASEKLTISLKDAISIALFNNPNIKNANNNLEVAKRNLEAIYKKHQLNVALESKAQKKRSKTSLASSTQDTYLTSLGSTWSKITPSSGLLTLSQGYGLSKNKIPSSEKFLSNPFISIELNQPLSREGRLQQRLPFINGEEEFKLANIDYRLTEEQLVFDVINNYYQLIRIKRLVKQTEEQVNLSKQLLKWTESRLKLGYVPKLDVMNAQMQLSCDRDFLIQAQEEKGGSQRKLLQLLGLNEDIEIELNEEIEAMVLNENIDKSIDEAIKNSPEVQKAEIELLQIKRNIDIAKSINKPTLIIS